MKYIYIILILGVILFIPLTAISGQLSQVVFISGVENGRCLVPNINLWNKPGGLYTGARVIEVIKGCVGLPVKIIETRYIGSRLWYHVKTFGTNAGKFGWLTDSFIKH